MRTVIAVSDFLFLFISICFLSWIMSDCRQVRRLGAPWWRNIADAYKKDILDLNDGSESFIQVGWPASGGVWVLQTTVENASERGVGMIQNAYNMEERCKAIERLGGIFYANPQDCIYLDLP
jgi:hypothetical protein